MLNYLKLQGLFPNHITENNSKFIELIEDYYKFNETKGFNLDLLNNIIKYFNLEYVQPNSIVEYNILAKDLLINDDVIYLNNTKGFPDTGYITINNEVILYNRKTNNTLNNCIRNNPIHHKKNDKVYNNLYEISVWFLNSIKKELLKYLPNDLNPNINFKLLVENFKQFYLSKGTENSIKFLFSIVFNNNYTVLKIKPVQNNASITPVISNGKIINAVVNNGGNGYISLSESYPTVKIYGSGKNGILEVSNVTNGVITAINVINGGIGYDQNNKIEITPKEFIENTLVRGLNSNASGYVKKYINNELTLYNVNGIFDKNEYVVADPLYYPENIKYYLKSNNNAAGIISDTYNIVNEPFITLPYNKILKTHINNTPVINLYIKSDDDIKLSNNLKLKQHKFKNNPEIIKNIENIVKINKNIYILSLLKDETNYYFPPETNVISNSSDEIIVDSTIGFPTTNGLLKLNNNEIIEYKIKTINSFKGIKRNINFNKPGISNNTNTNILEYDKLKLIGLINIKSGITKYELCKLELIDDKNSYNIEILGNNGKTIINNKGKYYNKTKIKSKNKKTTLNIFKVNEIYENKNYKFILSPSLPEYNHNNLRNETKQNLLRIIPKNNNLEELITTKKGIGITVDKGIEINSYKGGNILYGKIKKLTIKDFGDNYIINSNNIKLSINDIEYDNVIDIYGSIVDIDISKIPESILKDYIYKPDITVDKNIGDITGRDAEIDPLYSPEGTIVGFLIKNGGKWYNKIPIITIRNGGKPDYVIPSSAITIKGFIGRKSDYTNVTEESFSPKNYKELIIPTNSVYNSIPTIKINTGSGAKLYATIVNGSISNITIENSGSGYISEPIILLKNTDGKDAKFKAILEDGKIIGVLITNPGTGYTILPNIEIIPIEKNAEFECNIQNWTYNIGSNQNIDNFGGYIYNDVDIPLINKDVIPETTNNPQYLIIKPNMWGESIVPPD